MEIENCELDLGQFSYNGEYIEGQIIRNVPKLAQINLCIKNVDFTLVIML